MERLAEAQSNNEEDGVRCGQGRVDGGAAELDCDDRVQEADRGLKRLQVGVLVRKDAEDPWLYAETDPDVNVLFGRLEPSVSLGSLEDVVQDG